MNVMIIKRAFQAFARRLRLKTCLLVGTYSILLAAAGVFAIDKGDPQQGKSLFEENCVECHGRTGDGTGPVGYFLGVQPSDLLSVRSRVKTDAELFSIIKEGLLFDEMHGWEEELTTDDIWDLLRYIRTLAPHIILKR